MIIISALEQLFCRKSSINCIHHSLSNWFGHFLPSGRVMSRSVVRTLGCQKSSQDRLRLKHQPLPELAWHFTLYDSLVSRGLADEWVPVLDGRDTKIQTNTQIIWSYLIYIGGPKRRNTVKVHELLPQLPILPELKMPRCSGLGCYFRHQNSITDYCSNSK
jgi:hypothetical protein